MTHPLSFRGEYHSQKTQWIKNAHDDDIHDLIPLSPNYFATGSKDGLVKVWNSSGRQISRNTESSKVDHTKWITALSPLPENGIVSGSRDGILSVHEIDGSTTKQFQYTSQKPIPGCKDRNQNRITSLATLNQKDVFIGFAGGFTLFDLENGLQKSSCQTNLRNWVSCINPLSDQEIIAATGTELEIWEQKNSNWKKKATIQSVNDIPRISSERPFISTFTPLAGHPNLVAVAVFDGSVRIRDITKGKQITQFKEHMGRTWSVVNIDPGVIASCADDGTVKLWDSRQKQSALTLADHPGRVSALLPLDKNRLITASCPKEVESSLDKAVIDLWDIRRA